MSPNTRLPYITLSIPPTAEQRRQIEELLREQQDRNSANYHRWLTADEYADRFGPSRSDFAKIISWLQKGGFKIERQANGRNWVSFSGTAQQVARMFHTEIHRYRVNGEEHFANSTNLSVPAALSNVVGDVRGLTDFDLRPSPRTRAKQQPDFTSGGGTHYLAPGDIYNIYDITRVYGLSAGGKPINGTGQIIAVVGGSDLNLADDIEDFQSAFGLPTNVPIVQKGGFDPDIGSTQAQKEEALDLEWVTAIAPGATVYYVYATSPFDAAYYAIDSIPGLSVLSMSAGACEYDNQSLMPDFRDEAQYAASEGITWVAGSGDSGAAGCDGNQLPYSTTGVASVTLPASIPEVTAVGGTRLNDTGGNYWSSNNGAYGGSALGYIPEVGWNETSLKDGLASSGGGASSGMNAYPKPSWQTGRTPSDGQRDVPDVALAAAGDQGHNPYIICFNGECAGGLPSTPDYLGGTSAATPVFAGIVALLNQYLGYTDAQTPAGVGDMNQTLYSLPADVFHDITSGTNIVPCCLSTLFQTPFGYSAGLGYDQVTGLGSIDAYNLVTQWNPQLSATLTASPGSGPAPLTTTLTASASSAMQDTINYSFWFNCTDTSNSTSEVSSTCGALPSPAPGTCLAGSIGMKCNAVTPYSESASTVYSVSSTAKVIVEQGSATPAAASTSITINDSLPSVSALGFSPSSVTGGSPASGTVTLSGPAPSGGATVVLNPQPSGPAQLPASVPVLGGATSAPFTATTSPVPAPTVVSVNATYNNTQASGVLTITPASSSVYLQGLSFSPTTVNSGGTSTGTVMLTGPAPFGEAFVTFSATPQGVVGFPPPINVPAGATTASFVLNTLSVPNTTNVAVSASYNGTTVSATLTVNPSTSSVIVSNVSFNPANVVGGSTANGTVTLSGPAPSGGAIISFTGNPSGLVQIPSVTIAAGSASTAFSGSTSAVTVNTVVTVTATYQTSIAISSLTLTPSGGSVYLSSLTISPSTIVGGLSPLGIITLTGNAPAGGATVGLMSNNMPVADIPQMATVQPGNNSVTFPVTTFFTSGTQGATITANYNNTAYGATVTVLPVGVSGVTFYPSMVTAGSGAPFTVYLTGPAGAGTSVSLLSANPSVLQVPSTLPLSTGATSLSVTGTTFAVGSQTAVAVTATYNDSSSQGSLTIVPAPALGVNSINFTPATVTGGNTASGTLTLTGLAPSGGANVSLTSSSGLVQPPGTVPVAAGTSSANFSATTSAVSSITNVNVTASYGGLSQTATLTLVPPLPNLASLTLNPATVNSGSSSTGTVTLTAPAPLGGADVSLSSSFQTVAPLSIQGVNVPYGATSATFTINAGVVNFVSSATITASYNGLSQAALLIVVPQGTPLAPVSLTLSPASVTGGSPSTGTVLLTGPAPTGGSVITLSSDNSAAQVPLTITVSAGLTSGAFTVSTSSVSATTTATISASLNGIPESGLLTMNPSGSPPPRNPVPFLTSLLPVSEAPGGVGFALTIGGSGFVPGAEVLWNGTALPTTFVSTDEVQASIPASDVRTNTSALIAVTNPGSINTASNPLAEHLTYFSSTPSFNSSSVAVTGQPANIAVDDFNRDGKLDLAVGKSDGSGVSIFLGNGDGTLGPERLMPAISSQSVAVGDLNGDGKLDILINKTFLSGTVGVFLGNGDGTFTATPDVSLPGAGIEGGSLALADFNGDGLLDVAVPGPSGAYVLLGNGDGTFQSAGSFGSVSYPLALAVLDANGDGKPDLAIADSFNQAVAILLGNGDGTFQSQIEYSTNGAAVGLVAADFNGDGSVDLAVANRGGSTGGLAVLLGNGDGTFQMPVTYGAGEEFSTIAADDLNGDGKLDLLVSSASPAQTSLFPGNGDGTFSTTPLTLLPGTSPTGLTIADLNGDGAPDIVAPANGIGSFSLLLQSIAPILQLTPSSLSFTATQGGGSPPALSFTSSNAGGGTASWSASSSQTWLTLSPTSGTAPSTVQVNVNPSGLSAGTYSATITVTAAGASNSPQTVQVTLILNPAQVVIESLSFNPTTLTGPGSSTGTITLSGAAPTGGAVITLSSNNTAVQVPASATVTAGLISATFTATASAVSSQTVATVTATYNGVSTTATLTVNPGAPAVTFSPTSLTFPTQPVGTTSTARNVALTNTGTANLSITSISASGDFGETNTCGSSVAAGASCTIGVSFKPSKSGTRTGTLSVIDNAAGSPQTVSLTGVGTIVKLSPTSLNFGSVAVGKKSAAKNVTLTNAGTTPLSITSISATGPDSKDYSQSNTCGKSVSAGKSCTISVTFAPKAKGTRTASLSINDNGGGSPQTVSLTGKGT